MKRILLLGAALVAFAAPVLAADVMSEKDRTALLGKHKGGTLRMVAHAAGGTGDPHINYTAQYWQIYYVLYDGLLAFRKAGGTTSNDIVPDLAEAIPEPQDGGKTYVFKLRKDVKFSNGNDVTVKDVVASFQRIFKVLSPTAGGFYGGIVGADACIKTPETCTLEGGVIGDEAAGTVTLKLTAPDSEIFYKLAIPHASILPADSPVKDAGSVPIPGTGPYMIESYDPNKQLKIVRNPHFKQWNFDAQREGFVDEIHQDFGLDDQAMVTAVANAQADWVFDDIPSDRLAEIGKKYAKQAKIHPLFGTWYAPMNTRIPPFDNVKARQAVNFAVDRKALVGIYGGANLAAPTCQILPPGFPGYEPYCPYTKDPGTKWSAPDLDRAKKLVEESGTKGQKVTLISQDNATDKQLGTALVSTLNQIGYEATLKTLSNNIQFPYIQNTNNKVQISLTQWFQDYPAASDFLNILFGMDSFHEASDSSVNIAGFLDPKIDGVMKETMALAVTDLKAANKKWAEIDRMVTDASPAVALFTPKRLDFISARLGNYVWSDQFRMILSEAYVR